MARIVYAASGDGLGHATRAHSVGAGLLGRGHDVRFISCLRSTEYLSKLYPDRITDIFGFQLSCEEGRIHPWSTAVNLTRNGLKHLRPTLAHINELFHRFKPDLLITDVEWFSPWAAWRHGTPFISLDNQHLLTHCEVEIPPGLRSQYWVARGLIRCFSFGARRYLITTFVDATVSFQPTTLLPPVLRQAVYDTTPREGDYLVAYLGASGGSSHLRQALDAFNGMPIRAYGLGHHGQIGRVTYKPSSPAEFLADLAGCAGVVSSAGHSLISECMHLHKPMLLIPVIGQYEQILNAFHVQRMGLGQWRDRLAVESIVSFVRNLESYRRSFSRIGRSQLKTVLDAIEREL
jgi:uncharacterized protein (TIGR00661 family)